MLSQTQFRWKKCLFGSPSILALGIIGFFTYTYYFKFLPQLQNPIIAAFFFCLHTSLATLTIWSLLRTLLTDPGYLDQQFHCETSHEKDEVDRLNRIHYTSNGLLKEFKETTVPEQQQINNATNSDTSSSDDDIESTNNSHQPLPAKDEDLEINQVIQSTEVRVLQGPNITWLQIEQSIEENFHASIRSLVRYRYCNKCKQIKPPRTHHCSICDACVRRMDHHCPWVGNCIGIMNHKYFWNFLLYGFLGCLQVAGALFGAKGFAFVSEDLPYMIATVLSFAFSLSIGALLGVHTYLIMNNMSTLEVHGLEYQNVFAVEPTLEEHGVGMLARWKANAEMTLGQDEPLWRWFVPLEPRKRIYQGTDVKIKIRVSSQQRRGSNRLEQV